MRRSKALATLMTTQLQLQNKTQVQLQTKTQVQLQTDEMRCWKNVQRRTSTAERAVIDSTPRSDYEATRAARCCKQRWSAIDAQAACHRNTANPGSAVERHSGMLV